MWANVKSLIKSPAKMHQLDDLCLFMDENAAFMVQKCLYEYSRARTGTMSSQLFTEKDFLKQIEASRWNSYPLGMICLAKMVDSALYRYVMQSSTYEEQALIEKRTLWISKLADLILQIFNKYDTPENMPNHFWSMKYEHVKNSLLDAKQTSPLPVQDLPKEIHDDFFAQIPIHPSLTTYDYEMIGNTLRINLCGILDKFIQKFDQSKLLTNLTA